MLQTILVIEDDANLQTFISTLLTDNFYSVKVLADGVNAIKTIEKINPDLVLLDLNLPNIKGESVCSQIKKDYPALPVIILTAKSALSDKLNAFDLGADDYITKPFAAEELIARIKATLKQNKKIDKLKVADLEMNTESMEVKRNGKLINLTSQEYKLLECLILNKDKVLSRETLLNKIWQNSFDIETRVVDVYISYLRRKIDKNAKNKLIHSVRGFGYSLKAS
ncbi:MAG TPA: response regulator transcription factor [Candidatus Saccharimonadales bacterium]|nr:response regulator transcription factor [Candidatus Saccharimonadales bacterium]